MNYEKMGIAVSMIVLVGVLGVAVVASGEFDIGIDRDYVIPNITSSTSTDNDDFKSDGYYEWCYKIGIKDC
jgi:hypothetical protein